MNGNGRLGNLKRMLEAEPDDIFLNYALALEYLKTTDTLPLAEEQLHRVISIDSSYTAAYYQLGKLMEAQNKTTEAIVLFRRGLAEAKAKNDRKTASEFEEAIFLIED